MEYSIDCRVETLETLLVLDHLVVHSRTVERFDKSFVSAIEHASERDRSRFGWVDDSVSHFGQMNKCSCLNAFVNKHVVLE